MNGIGVLQNFARKYWIPINTIIFQFHTMPKGGNYETKLDDGCYVEGMFAEGVRWDNERMLLAESLPKKLYSEAPMLWLQPIESHKKKQFPSYLSPIYRTSKRWGVLATTGHSSNFVMNVELPSDKPNDYWVRRGVAMLLSLSDWDVVRHRNHSLSLSNFQLNNNFLLQIHGFVNSNSSSSDLQHGRWHFFTTHIDGTSMVDSPGTKFSWYLQQLPCSYFTLCCIANSSHQMIKGFIFSS